MLNPKTESIKINDEEIRKIMKVKKKKLEEGQIIELDNKKGEEEEKEEEEEEEEEKEKEREERKEKYEDEVIFTGQSFRSQNKIENRNIYISSSSSELSSESEKDNNDNTNKDNEDVGVIYIDSNEENNINLFQMDDENEME
ncbi:hypothetical protein Glove_9g364 [Diversispora epigaea]|uniref:Uncharacterized protein n=1 Tax=Diversispora epigaea TaxID=1348612 RepID=A0A397JY76_9GLOM|nr:hypothetical protein Glove_9g364 [Diversispora epigaea]